MTPVIRHLCRAALLAALCALGGAATVAFGAAAVTNLSLASTSRNACSPRTLTAPAGSISLSFTNATDDWQSFGVIGVGVGSPDRVREGATSTLTATLAAGTYAYWCGDDQSKGMRGSLTVTAPSGSTEPAPPPPPPPPAAGLSITTFDNSFSTSSLAADAGNVTITVRNAGAAAHTFTIGGVVNVIVAPGQTKTQSFFANAGTYTFVCAYHGEMRGTLTVRPGANPPPTRPPPPPPPAAPAPAPPGAAGVTITDFAFSPGSLAMHAGTVTLAITNAGQLPHTFTIDGLVNVDLAPGQSTIVGFSAPPGTYRFYCAVPGHVGLGMTGTLVVAAESGAAPPAPPPPVAPAAPAEPAAGGGHAGHEPAGPAETPQQLAPGCRPRSTIVLRGTVVSASPRQLTLAVARTNRAGRAYANRRAAVVLHTKTVFGRVGAPALQGLAPGDSLTVYAGRCRAYRRKLLAVRVVVANAPVDTAGGTTLQLTADPKGYPRFDKKSLEAPAGKVTLTLTNPSPLPHNISIAGVGTGKQVVNGGRSTVTGDLKTGTYTYLCTLPGHAQAGMKGTLTVR